MRTIKRKLLLDFKAMLETEYEKSKEDQTSKVVPFMEDTWKGYSRQGLDAMLSKTRH